MKIKINILVILIVIILLLGAVVALMYIPEKSTEFTDDKIPEKNTVEILNIDDNLKTYNHTVGEDGYSIAYSNGRWNVMDNENIVLDNSSVYKMLSIISKLTTYTVVEENASDLSKYGVENPLDLIEVTDMNGNIYTLKIGTQTATESGYYAVVNNDRMVFILSGEDYNILCGGVNALRDKEVVAINGDVYSITITNPETTMTIQPKTTTNVNASNLSKWEMISPYKKDVNEYIFTENVIKALDFTIYDFVDDNPTDYNVYGLKNPEYTIEIVTTSDSYKILLGYKAEGNKIYMKTADAPNVYLISADAVKYRDFTPVYLLDSLAFSRNISAVEIINFKSDRTYEMKIESNSFFIDDKKTDEEQFRETYLAFISSVISGEIIKDKVGMEICRYTFEYNTNTPSETVIFYEYGDMYSAVSINGVTEFYVKRSYVDDMINAVKKLAE